MAVQIGARPDSGFDDPIGMLKDCHRRIEHFLKVLCRVAEDAQPHVLNAEESAAVQSALRYFHEGGQRHTADEEESLFPRLRRATAASGLAAVDRLEHDHREADDLHASVDHLYSKWISTGALGAEERQFLLSKTNLLRHLYTEHMQVEETLVFPQAARVLDSDSIAAIGLEFRARRK